MQPFFRLYSVANRKVPVLFTAQPNQFSPLQSAKESNKAVLRSGREVSMFLAVRYQVRSGTLKLVSANRPSLCASGEMADTPDLGSGPARGGGSSPLSRTIGFSQFVHFRNGFNPKSNRTQTGTAKRQMASTLFQVQSR